MVPVVGGRTRSGKVVMMRTRAFINVLAFITALGISIVNVANAYASSDDRIEIEAVFQNGDGYQAATSDVSGSLIKLHVNMQNGTATSHLVRFGGLGERIRGDKVQILDARLELYYVDEYWTRIKYHVVASCSLDGTVDHISPEPEGDVIILGDKWPVGEKTPRPSWISLPIRPATILKWVKDEKNNHGLVLHVSQVNRGQDEKLVDLQLDIAKPGAFFTGFRSTAGWGDKKTPRLVVRYRVTGNAPPAPPVLHSVSDATKVYTNAEITWLPSEDPNPDDKVRYEFQSGYQLKGQDIVWSEAIVRLEANRTVWSAATDRDRFYKGLDVAETGRKLWYRVRAVDGAGDASSWTIAGPVTVTNRPWTVWGTHGNHKIWPDIRPLNEHADEISIHAAKNEWEPFQVVVMSHAGLSEVRIEASELTDGKGNTIPEPTIFREHYLPISDTANRKYGHIGMVPDALVPLIHPLTNKPTSGKYGGDIFDIPVGGLEAFWLDIFVDRSVPAGVYHGHVNIVAKGVEPISMPVKLEVFDFALPSPKHLLATFQLSRDAVKQSHALKGGWAKKKDSPVFGLAHDYEEMMHDHYINNWSPITGFNYGLNGVKVRINSRKVFVDWSEFDALVESYMDGSAYRDGVPAQTLFVPYWIPVKKAKSDGWALRVNKWNYKNIELDLFGQYMTEVQRHMKEKGWLDRAYVFYFDEPFISEWKYAAFIQTSKVIRKVAPELKIMITDGYKSPEAYKKKAYITEPIEDYVDVWDPVTFQVSSLEQANYYRKRKEQGKFDIWCQTLANSNTKKAVINLFPEYDMPFHRMWGVMSWNFGFQGIEWWQTIVWWDGRTKTLLDPWTDPKAFPGFRKPLNSDGRLFFPGTPDAIGGPDIPISSLRMKAIREAIEDYEYLYILDQLGGIKEFPIDTLHTTDSVKATNMKLKMPMGKEPWHWWEGDPDVMMQAKEKLARMIQQRM